MFLSHPRSFTFFHPILLRIPLGGGRSNQAAANQEPQQPVKKLQWSLWVTVTPNSQGLEGCALRAARKGGQSTTGE